jgi:hypothetical protein
MIAITRLNGEFKSANEAYFYFVDAIPRLKILAKILQDDKWPENDQFLIEILKDSCQTTDYFYILSILSRFIQN